MNIKFMSRMFSAALTLTVVIVAFTCTVWANEQEDYYGLESDTVYLCYECGIFICDDCGGVKARESIYSLRHRAEEGDKSAQYALGKRYIIGLGIEQDFEQAVYWHRQAADKGHAEAQALLGALYYEGLGVQQDFEYAIYWFAQAAKQGHFRAIVHFAEIALDNRALSASNDIPAPCQVLAERPANNPIRGSIFGYGVSRLYEIQYDVRYIFEQNMLPRAVYENKDTLIDLINTSNVDGIEDFIFSNWANGAWLIIISDWMETGQQISGIESVEQLTKFLESKMYEYGLSVAQHLLNITVEEVNESTSAVIIEMSEPGWALLSTYIGIVYAETLGLQIFTLERSFDSGEEPQVYMFCAVSVDSRMNFGPIENSKEAFVNAIRDLMQEIESN